MTWFSLIVKILILRSVHSAYEIHLQVFIPLHISHQHPITSLRYCSFRYSVLSLLLNSFYNTSFSSLSFSAFFCSNFSFTLKLKKKFIKYDVQCSSKQITRKRSEFNAKFCIYLILAFDYIQSLQFHAKFFMLIIFDTYTMPPID